jgi:hypothetical protein
MKENARSGLPKSLGSPNKGRWVAAVKGVYLLPCLALVLQGCSKSPTDDWLVGGWTAADQSCNSGTGYIFERTGQWRTEGEEGTWKLDGSDLTINVTGTYGDDSESNDMKPSNEVYAYHITEFDKNGFATSASGEIPAIKWKRCSFDLDQTPPPQEGQPPAPETPAPQQPAAGGGSLFGPSEQKIIWEWTGGMTYNSRVGGYLVSTPQQCRAMSESMQSYSQQGWKIVSSTPNTRFVQNGSSCEGRDIVIEN